MLSPLPVGAAIAVWVSAGLALLGWQIVGAWRGARECSSAPVDVGGIWGGYIAILCAVVMVGIAIMDGVMTYLPKPPPTAGMSGPTFNVAFDAPNASVQLNGDLNYASTAALLDVLKREPQTRRVILNSDGGHVFAARALAEKLVPMKLRTHVDERCYSACTIVFMSGLQRTMGATGKLGFHRYAFANRFIVPTVDPETEQQKDIRFFRRQGVNADFLERVFKARHDRMWTPDRTSLLAASVLTEAAD